jgi:hypothetical protein
MGHGLLAATAGLLLFTFGAAAQVPSPRDEGTAAGSGATGMTPQQGTGSGATQSSPSSNAAPSGHGPGAETQQNREYGKETAPEGQDLHQGRADRPKQ